MPMLDVAGVRSEPVGRPHPVAAWCCRRRLYAVFSPIALLQLSVSDGTTTAALWPRGGSGFLDCDRRCRLHVGELQLLQDALVTCAGVAMHDTAVLTPRLHDDVADQPQLHAVREVWVLCDLIDNVHALHDGGCTLKSHGARSKYFCLLKVHGGPATVPPTNRGGTAQGLSSPR